MAHWHSHCVCIVDPFARVNNLIKNLLITTENARTKEQKNWYYTYALSDAPRTCSLRDRITLSTYLHEGDENDEERRRAACVVIGVILSVPFLREEFIADHADHPENTNILQWLKNVIFIICVLNAIQNVWWFNK